MVSLPNESSYGSVGSVWPVDDCMVWTANERNISIKKHCFENFAMVKVFFEANTKYAKRL